MRTGLLLGVCLVCACMRGRAGGGDDDDDFVSDAEIERALRFGDCETLYAPGSLLRTWLGEHSDCSEYPFRGYENWGDNVVLCEVLTFDEQPGVCDPPPEAIHQPTQECTDACLVFDENSWDTFERCHCVRGDW